LYTAGDDANAKQFRSLHAVQRHMVDTNQCKMLFSDNEDEYADFYDYSSADNDGEEAASAAEQSAGEAGRQLALATSGLGALNLGASSAQGFELTVAGAGDGISSTAAGKTLGSRELARYYKQRPKPQDTRQSVAVNTVVAQYR
jgi:pre-60S factor REI1